LYLKKPKILLNKNFNFDKFKTKFNFILDFNVSQHLDFSQKKNLIKKINLYLSKNGKYILSPAINLDYKLLKLNNLQIKSIKQTKIIKNIYSTKFSFCVIKKIKN